MSGSRRDWYDIAALLVLLLALFMVTSCATTRTSAPTRALPPPEAWPACVAFCEAHNAPYLGIVIPDPNGKRFGCGCGVPAAAAPQSWDGPT